jgi:hypothetical protein
MNNNFVHGLLPCVGTVFFLNDTSQIEFMMDLNNCHNDDDIQKYLGGYLADKYKLDNVKKEIIIRLLSVYYTNIQRD